MTATTHSPDTGATHDQDPLSRSLNDELRSPSLGTADVPMSDDPRPLHAQITATYVPERWSEPWNQEGTPIGETLDLGMIGDFGDWVEGLLPGRYELTNGHDDHVGTLVIGAPKIVVHST